MITYEYDLLNNSDVRITCININEGNLNDNLKVSKYCDTSFKNIKRIRIKVPAEINGLIVKELGSSSIEQNQKKEIINSDANLYLKENFRIDLIVSEGITHILQNAFRNSNLLSIDLPHSIEHIGKKAFSDNHPLDFLKIPKKLSKQFEDFYGISSYKSKNLASTSASSTNKITYYSDEDIILEQGNSHYTKSDSGIFSKNGKIMINYIGKFDISEYIIPNSVEVIGKGCFYSAKRKHHRNAQIKSIVIPDSVKVIEERALSGIGLESVYLSNNLETIEEGAFSLNDLESINLPESLVSLGKYSFDSNKIKEVKIPSKIKEIPKRCFSYNKIKRLNFPKNLEKIGDSALYGNNLSEVFLPKKITDISGIIKLEGLKKITVDKENLNFSNIDGIVYSKDKKQLIKCPDSMGLAEFTVPSGVEIIQRFAFANCKLFYIEFPDSLKCIGDSAFSNNNLIEVNIPESVKNIGRSAFANNKIITLNLPKVMNSIEGYAFSNNRLKEVIMPDKIDSIGSGVFLNNKM